ncbi:MAG: site-specific tyrosine recombinase XerD [Bacteroidales bacterium]|nr:site-specific tyrosine recombinase XerD [Bacteroidales bacterium]
MDWKELIKEYKIYLQLEKSLSENSVLAYMRDLKKLTAFMEEKRYKVSPETISSEQLEEFVRWTKEKGANSRSQMRIISGIKGFFKYLIMANRMKVNPAELLESPKTGRKLPDVLSISEIEQIIGAIDLSKPEGERNKAIIETLYGCGLRVSELVNLKISGLHFSESFIRIIGKGDKERLAPIGAVAIKQINIYLEKVRVHIKPKKGCEDIVFLNRRGAKLTREMIFMIIKELCKIAGITKKVSPHSFRHSFATHLMEGGADIRAVQQMLGHESITTTEIYTHLNREYLRDTIMQYHPRSSLNE